MQAAVARDDPRGLPRSRQVSGVLLVDVSRVWRHGDWARVDDDGQWFLLGRSDEALNAAGKGVGPAEVESELLSHPAVAETATIGVPDGTKGEAIWCFWTPVDPEGADVSDELVELVAERLGRPFKPGRMTRVSDLPRTRSAKILRRAVRAVAVGEDPVGYVGRRESRGARDRAERPRRQALKHHCGSLQTASMFVRRIVDRGLRLNRCSRSAVSKESTAAPGRSSGSATGTRSASNRSTPSLPLPTTTKSSTRARSARGTHHGGHDRPRAIHAV